MANIILRLSENKETNYRKQRVVGRVGDGSLTTIDVYLLQADQQTPYIISDNDEILFVGINQNNEYTEGIPEVIDRQNGLIRYTFSKENFSVSRGFKRAYFKLENASGVVSFQDFTVEVLSGVDLSEKQAAVYVTRIEKIILELQTNYEEIITEMDKDFQQFLNNKDKQYQQIYQMYNDLVVKLNQNTDKLNQLSQSQANLAKQADETAKQIADNNILTKDDKFISGDVIDTITGATKATFEEEFAVNGDDAVGSIYVKDLPYKPNLIPGTSDEWKELGFNGWNGPILSMTKLTMMGLTVGDTVAMKIEIDNTIGLSSVVAKFQFFDADRKTISTISGSAVAKGAVGFSSVEAKIPDGTVFIYYYALGSITLLTDKTTVKYRNDKFIKGTTKDLDEWCPSSLDYGIVPGQPNLLNGTSNEWEEVTFTSWDTGENTVPYDIPLSQIGKIGDALTIISEIDNTSSSECYTKIQTLDINKSLITESGSKRIPANTKGFSQGSLKIPENTVYIRWKKASKTDSTNKVTVKVRGHKLIQDVGNAMDGYTPSQADSGLTPINNGMVPFNETQNEAIQSETGVVRAETLIVGRGAEIQFDFDVIGALEERHPFLFAGLNTVADKVAKYKQIATEQKTTVTHRGGGLPDGSDTSVKNNYSRMYNFTSQGVYWGITASNKNSSFAKQINVLQPTTITYIPNDGVMKLTVASRKNGTSEAGCISDGVTPAWVEVKDISLQVTLDVDGKTIVETIIAEVGDAKYNSKTDFESYKTTVTDQFKNVVDIASNQTVGGVKNFKDGMKVGGNNVLTQSGVKVYDHTKSTDSTIASGTVRFTRFGDFILANFNFQCRTGSNINTGETLITTLETDIIPHNSVQVSLNDNQVVTIDPAGKVSTLWGMTAAKYYAGSAMYLAKNKL